MRSFRFNKHGIAEDPRYRHVVWRQDGRDMIADVVGVYVREFPFPCTMLRVRHFCGDPIPDIAASAVKVLLREWEE